MFFLVDFHHCGVDVLVLLGVVDEPCLIAVHAGINALVFGQPEVIEQTVFDQVLPEFLQTVTLYQLAEILEDEAGFRDEFSSEETQSSIGDFGFANTCEFAV